MRNGRLATTCCASATTATTTSRSPASPIEGGRLWRYSTNNGPDGLPNTGDEFDIVREQITNQGSTVKLKQHAYYIEDSWSITDNFLAYLGGRWDTFENLNGDGEAYVKIDNQFGPRLGFSWDVNGDSTLKIYGNAGRYALPLTPSVAVRGASASLFTARTSTSPVSTRSPACRSG